MIGEESATSGRMFDQKGGGLHAYEDIKGKDGKDPSFTLDYYDEYGRKMTQKQAFRQMSWKFHGKCPSKKNREKRMLEVEKQMAEQKQDRAMDYMHALQAAQASTKSAHVVLTGVNAFKPSDVAAPKLKPEGGKKKKAKTAL